MKILHTSDWHIGKRLMNRERLNEQSQALDEIAEICEREGVELVLVAGDVFDTYLPSAEAEELFFEKIRKIRLEGITLPAKFKLSIVDEKGWHREETLTVTENEFTLPFPDFRAGGSMLCLMTQI